MGSWVLQKDTFFMEFFKGSFNLFYGVPERWTKLMIAILYVSAHFMPLPFSNDEKVSKKSSENDAFSRTCHACPPF